MIFASEKRERGTGKKGGAYANMFQYGVLWLLLIADFGAAQELGSCSSGQTLTFVKWVGVRPDRPNPAFFYVASGDEASLPAVCLARCRELVSCAGTAVVQGRGECSGFTTQTNRTLILDNDVNFFEKVCLRVPEKCVSRWWGAEATPGYHLHAEGRHQQVLLNVTLHECAGETLASAPTQNSLQYRSAQWISQQPDLGRGAGERVSVDQEALGSCILNQEDKYTEPESYRVANYHTVYLENQCRHDFPAKIDRCSYEEYYNQTLKHADLSLPDLTKEECKTSCEVEERFVCRGFTWTPELRGHGDQWGQEHGGQGSCNLHSEDVLTVGSWLLRKAIDSTYYRRVTCLNISVECTEEEMVVTYRPRGVFKGRVYVPGKGDGCGAGARGVGGVVRLVLPLNGDCDVNFAYGISQTPEGIMNRTMAYAMVMIQSNPIIQTGGDRWVRVGCSPALVHRSARVHSELSVHDDHAKASYVMEDTVAAGSLTPASAVYNSSGSLPPVSMYVVRAGDDEYSGLSGPAVSLGEMLELRVETPVEEEIEAFHLVASSRLGDSSVLLLDSRGCPTGQVDFPGFTRSSVGRAAPGRAGTQRLSARFKAFRFPNSHVVRFALMVRFCSPRCAQSNCAKNRQSRSPNDTLEEEDAVNDVEATVVEDAPWGSEGHSGRGVVAQSGAPPVSCVTRPDRIPLELELLVGSKDLLTADTLVRADHGGSVLNELHVGGGGGGGGALVCLHETVLVAGVLLWLVVQVLLLVGCCILVKRYRSLAEMSSHKDYQSFDNVGFDTLSTHRRVHWPDQHVDILHVT